MPKSQVKYVTRTAALTDMFPFSERTTTVTFPKSVALINDIKRSQQNPISVSTRNLSYSSALVRIHAEPSPMSFLNVHKYVLCKLNLVSLIYSSKLAILYAINVVFTTLPTIMNSPIQIKR